MNRFKLSRIILLLAFFLPIMSFADTCPSVESIKFIEQSRMLGITHSYTPTVPGWTLEHFFPGEGDLSFAYEQYNQDFVFSAVILDNDPSTHEIAYAFCLYRNLNDKSVEFALAAPIKNLQKPTIDFVNAGWAVITLPGTPLNNWCLQ